MIFEAKLKRDVKGQKTEQLWMNTAQLLKHYGDKDVVKAVQASRTEEEKRVNPMCPTVKAGNEYLVTVTISYKKEDLSRHRS